jgi:hypothetical protein
MISKSQTTLLFIRRATGLYRTLTTEAKIEETAEPAKKKTARKKSTETKRSKEILAHFDTPEKRHVLSSYPEAMLRRKLKIVGDLYNTSEETAQTIFEHLTEDLPANRPIVECFPGEGHLTNLLVNETPNKLLLFEPESKFNKNLEVSSRRF